ncbi:hypothetical protein, partial [Escherichia coli]|uniref:hypothetical protein n=1 Tax=Escherichia coli TaxID=562 RepID=UPI0020BF3DB0
EKLIETQKGERVWDVKVEKRKNEVNFGILLGRELSSCSEVGRRRKRQRQRRRKLLFKLHTE